jgi:hypothetical protein
MDRMGGVAADHPTVRAVATAADAMAVAETEPELADVTVDAAMASTRVVVTEGRVVEMEEPVAVTVATRVVATVEMLADEVEMRADAGVMRGVGETVVLEVVDVSAAAGAMVLAVAVLRPVPREHVRRAEAVRFSRETRSNTSRVFLVTTIGIVARV